MLKPADDAEKVTVAPGVIEPDGLTELIETVGGLKTMICWMICAVVPVESVALTVMLCMPISLVFGTQLKMPEELISAEEIVPPMESVRV